MIKLVFILSIVLNSSISSVIAALQFSTIDNTDTIKHDRMVFTQSLIDEECADAETTLHYTVSEEGLWSILNYGNTPVINLFKVLKKGKKQRGNIALVPLFRHRGNKEYFPCLFELSAPGAGKIWTIDSNVSNQFLQGHKSSASGPDTFLKTLIHDFGDIVATLGETESVSAFDYSYEPGHFHKIDKYNLGSDNVHYREHTWPQWAIDASCEASNAELKYGTLRYGFDLELWIHQSSEFSLAAVGNLIQELSQGKKERGLIKLNPAPYVGNQVKALGQALYVIEAPNAENTKWRITSFVLREWKMVERNNLLQTPGMVPEFRLSTAKSFGRMIPDADGDVWFDAVEEQDTL